MRRIVKLSRITLKNTARAAAVLALVTLITSVAAACPTCTDGLAQNDPQGQAIAAGFYYSILFMMAMPFTILASFGGLAYISIRRAQQANTDAEVSPETCSATPAAAAITRE